MAGEGEQKEEAGRGEERREQGKTGRKEEGRRSVGGKVEKVLERAGCKREEDRRREGRRVTCTCSLRTQHFHRLHCIRSTQGPSEVGTGPPIVQMSKLRPHQAYTGIPPGGSGMGIGISGSFQVLVLTTTS